MDFALTYSDLHLRDIGVDDTVSRQDRNKLNAERQKLEKYIITIKFKSVVFTIMRKSRR
jgi:G:T/U-mismatch repair DNA glycosylase